jgi:glycerol-3-phosphate dehydrogenase
VTLKEDDIDKLETLKRRGESNGVEGLSIIERKKLRKIEPALTDGVKYALYAPTGGIVSPYELTFALAENACNNGVRIYCNAEVTGIENTGNDDLRVSSSAGVFNSRIVINSAGRFSDDISRLAGMDTFKIMPRRGEYILLDKRTGVGIYSTIFPLPTKLGKGIVVTPTTGGNILLGPTAEDVDDKTDLETTSRGQEKVFSSARELVPGISKDLMITSFTGLRSISTSDDFIIGPTSLDGFINAAGIQSPGLTAAPAIAKLMVKHVQEALGLDELLENSSFNPIRKRQLQFRTGSPEDRIGLIEKNIAYSNVICRCENVTEAEVIAGIRAKPGATTVDGIKLRTRAGMGRCQGGYCTDRVMKLLDKELDSELVEITKSGGSSWILSGRTKNRY